MKTPMQELIERLECLIGLTEGTKYAIGLKSAKEQAESILEKEKEVIMDAYIFGIQDEYVIGSQRYYNETFNTKEK